MLSVPRGATDQQIKRAYRKLAVQYHPVRMDVVYTGRMRGLFVGCMCGSWRGAGVWAGYAGGLCFSPHTPLHTQQDKVSGSDAEKEAAAKKFAEINHGAQVMVMVMVVVIAHLAPLLYKPLLPKRSVTKHCSISPPPHTHSI